MRCPNCNRFVSIEISEPNIEELTINNSAVSASIRITKDCAECNESLAEYTFDFEESIKDLLDNHSTDDHSLEVKEDMCDSTQRTEGMGQGKKTFYGVKVEYFIDCSCSESSIYHGTFSDDIQASHMEEI